VKDTKVCAVQMVNGQQQKTEVSNQAAQQGGREGRLKKHVVQKKKGEFQVIKNYVKQGDSVTFTLDPQSRQLQNVRVASYLNDPKNAVTISAEFAQLPDPTNHVAGTLINGESKQLTVNEQNSNYRKTM
jgi:plastocyanin